MVWHADLAHGGGQEVERRRTRKSLVTHHCPVELAPHYFDWGPHSRRLSAGDERYYCYPCPWEPRNEQEVAAGDEG